MSRTIRSTRRAFYENKNYHRDGSPGNYLYRDIISGGKSGDEDHNNKKALSRRVRREIKRELNNY